MKEDKPQENNVEHSLEDEAEEQNAEEKQQEPVEEVSQKEKEQGFSLDVTKVVSSFVIVSLLFLGVYVFFLDTEPTTTSYNNHIFEKLGPNEYQTMVVTNQGDTELEFRNHPRDVDSIPYDNELSLPLRLAQETNSTLYISISEELSTVGEAGIAATEITRIVSFIHGVETRGAFMEEGVEPTAEVITCENATPNTPVITIERGDQTEIDVTDGTCIRLLSDTNMGLIEASSALIYRLLGVIPSE